MDRGLIAIYLNDHLAGATAGLELARRAEGSNRGSEFGSFLAELAGEIQSDRELLVEVMRRLAVREDRLKTAFAWLAEKAGRLKLNGELLSYSPLSRLVELEALALGVHGKLAMWRTLGRLAETEETLSGIDFRARIAGAQSQLRRIERRRSKAAEQALGGEVSRGRSRERLGPS
jgi:hypothetical protein